MGGDASAADGRYIADNFEIPNFQRAISPKNKVIFVVFFFFFFFFFFL